MWDSSGNFPTILGASTFSPHEFWGRILPTRFFLYWISAPCCIPTPRGFFGILSLFLFNWFPSVSILANNI